jgi:hypothetical protein
MEEASVALQTVALEQDFRQNILDALALAKSQCFRRGAAPLAEYLQCYSARSE